MGFFDSISKGIASGFRTLIGGFKSVAETTYDIGAKIIQTAKINFEKWEEWLRQNNHDIDDFKFDRFKRIRDINDELEELNKKRRIDGGLPSDDLEQYEFLLDEKKRFWDKLENITEYETAKDINNNQNDYHYKETNPLDPVELIRLCGQVIHNKKCVSCGKPVTLKFKKNIREPKITDLFWGCSGYFMKGDDFCSFTSPLSRYDQELFVKYRPGNELSTEKQNAIITRPETAQLFKNKLKDAINEPSENYICPVHLEKMQLKENKNADDLLDLYYLQCSRANCNHSEKIKTASQLSAVLEAYDKGDLFS